MWHQNEPPLPNNGRHFGWCSGHMLFVLLSFHFPFFWYIFFWGHTPSSLTVCVVWRAWLYPLCWQGPSAFPSQWLFRDWHTTLSQSMRRNPVMIKYVWTCHGLPCWQGLPESDTSAGKNRAERQRVNGVLVALLKMCAEPELPLDVFVFSTSNSFFWIKLIWVGVCIAYNQKVLSALINK